MYSQEVTSHLINKGTTLFTTLPVLTAYLTFLLAEKFNMGVSGLLALSTVGIVLNLNM